MSYGFSLWLVFIPSHYLSKLLLKYNRKAHFPHVTIKTNIKSLEEAIELKKTYKHWTDTIKIIEPSKNFTKMYRNDPLYGWGFPVVLQNIHTNHEPHLTIAYSNKPIIKHPWINLFLQEKARLKIVDTRSKYPWEWGLAYE